MNVWDFNCVANSEKRVLRNLAYFVFAFLTLLTSISSADTSTIQRNNWYLSQSDESVTIQMSGHETEAGAIAFISNLNLSGDIGYYQARYKNKPWFAVTYGLFSSLAEARSHLKTLPESIQQMSPWPRSFKVIRSLIAVAEDNNSNKTPVVNDSKKRTPPKPTWEQGQVAYKKGNFKEAFDSWEKLAKEGDDLSQFYLGILYSRGEGVDLDRGQSLKWYQKSAEQGYAPAQFNLGAAFVEANTGSENAHKAAIWWQKAADQGFAQAQFNLASLYCKGLGVTRDKERCKFWYKRAASNGDILARKMLIQLTETEKENNAKKSTKQPGQSRSIEKSRPSKPVVAKTPTAKIQHKQESRLPKVRKLTRQERTQLRRAQAAFTRNKYTKSHKLWLPLAESGIAEAQYSLGFLYQTGWGPERDLKKAVSWYSNAAMQDEARAQFNLGVILLSGEDGIEKNIESGLLWLTHSANSNNTRAKEFLVNLYTTGKYGIEPSKEKADYWKSH